MKQKLKASLSKNMGGWHYCSGLPCREMATDELYIFLRLYKEYIHKKAHQGIVATASKKLENGTEIVV